MKWILFAFITFCSLNLLAQEESLKTVVKDNGDTDRMKVDTAKACQEVLEEQQRLMKLIRPEYKGAVTLKEATTLEVFRSNNEFGYAAKCILKFPVK